MDQEEKMELYLKGYEDGQKEAWSNIKKLISRYEGWDLKSRVESKIGTLYQEVQSKKVELQDEPSILEISEEGEAKREVDLVIDEWEKGNSYLFLNGDEIAYKELQSLFDRDIKGLIISRESPEKIVNKYNISEKVQLIWLTKSTSKKIENDLISWSKISPGNLSKLSSEIGNFLKRNKNGCVFVSGIPSLINYNDFEKVLKFISWVIDRTYQRHGYLIVSLSHLSLKEEYINTIKDEFDFVSEN